MFEAFWADICFVKALPSGLPSSPSKDMTPTGLIATEPGRELHERIVKIGTWDDLENITEIEPGKELHGENHADWHL